MTAEEIVQTSTVVTFRPGDMVLIGLRELVPSQDQRFRMREMLEERFPGVQFAVMAGVQCIAVQHADGQG